jgi:very-short-patch-repair endonuclease
METKRSALHGAGLDQGITQLAEAQHGVVARRQLIELGLSDAQVKGRIAQSRLHVVHRGVYAVGHRMLSQRGRWMAAVLFAGPEAVLSHRSAAELWGIVPRRGRAIDVTRRRGWRASPGIVVHRDSISADEIETVAGIPCTCAPRTSLDLAGSASRGELQRVINQIEVRCLTHTLSVYDLLERYPRRRGAPMLRVLFDDRAETRGITRSRLEERFAALLARSDLPRPRLNTSLAVRGRFFEVDCLWREQRVIVELDGMQAHGTDLAFEKDRERDRLLIAEGWRVTRITWRQLRDDAPAVLADLSTLLRTPPPRPTL